MGETVPKDWFTERMRYHRPLQLHFAQDEGSLPQMPLVVTEAIKFSSGTQLA